MAGLAREPLVQFLAVGLAIYLGAAWLSKGDASSPSASEIVVDRPALLAFVQARTGEADARVTAAAFDSLEPATRKSWIDRFVREEALVRHAKALGLDRDDELIRRRLVQKMEFLTLGVVEGEIASRAEDLEAYYQLHAEEYRVQARVTFAHVFVRASAQDAAARERAQSLLGELNAAGLGFSESLASGDRFLYNRHYVDRTFDEVRSHFGETMAEDLAALEPEPTRWQGPLASEHGWHLVLLVSREESRLPPLAEIRGELRRDLERERREQALEKGIRAIVSRYRVDLAEGLDPEARPDSATDPGAAPKAPR